MRWKSGPRLLPRDVVFGQPADPQVDVVDGAVQLLQLVLHVDVLGDLREAGDRFRP